MAAPPVECLLQGSVPDDPTLTKLLERLTGICGSLGTEVELHEMVFGFPLDGGKKQSDVRVRHNLKTDSWRIVQYASMNFDKSLKTNERQLVDIGCGTDALVPDMLQAMGGRIAFAFLSRGWIFKSGLILVSVVRITKLEDPLVAHNEGNTLGDGYLVEASCCVSPERTKQAAERLVEFARLLVPYVSLVRFDHTKLRRQKGR